MRGFELDNYAVQRWFFAMIEQAPPADSVSIACERFTIGERTLRTARGDEYWSIETIGLLRFLCRMHDLKFQLYGAGDAKHFASNPNLKKAGWFTPGQGHRNDAARIVVLARADQLAIPPPWLLH